MLSSLNGIYQPKPGTNVSTDCLPHIILLMWTNICGWPDRSKELRANHFVRLLPISTGKCENAFWNVVGRKRNIKKSTTDTSRRGAKSRKTVHENEKNRRLFSSNKTVKAKNGLNQFFEPQVGPRKNYSTLFKTTKRKGVTGQSQSEVSPKNERPDEDSAPYLSMPLLTRNWFEKNSFNMKRCPACPGSFEYASPIPEFLFQVNCSP